MKPTRIISGARAPAQPSQARLQGTQLVSAQFCLSGLRSDCPTLHPKRHVLWVIYALAAIGLMLMPRRGGGENMDGAEQPGPRSGVPPDAIKQADAGDTIVFDSSLNVRRSR